MLEAEDLARRAVVDLSAPDVRLSRRARALEVPLHDLWHDDTPTPDLFL